MSDALNYLMKVRPDAMTSYFGFLKESGKHLDPKTRAIISVITKVDNQTSAGFKQYLKRALKEGVSANEIIDALLTAFPTLGLTKIIWAMELLLEMNLPEFEPDRLEQDKQWYDVCSVSQLREEFEYVSAHGKELLIYHNVDGFQVYDSRCPHQANCIPKQVPDEYSIVCPNHGWRFDIRTGECIEKGDRPLTKLEYKIEREKLLVFW